MAANTPRAVFSYNVIDGVVAVKDLAGETSVTNDAEAVIDYLRRAGVDLATMRVVYCDQMLSWDEIIVRDGRFHGFNLLDGMTFDHAQRVMKKGPQPL